MAQIFHRSTNTIARVSIYGAALLLLIAGYLGYAINASPYFTEVNNPRPQPVPFSHKHHVGELGLTCHSQIWTGSSMLEPVRASYRDEQSLSWTRVNAVPDFVYFNHSIHIDKGVGCTTCHGPIGEMNITWRSQSLYMRWCLDCHNGPEKYLRPRSQVFNAFYEPPKNQLALGLSLKKEYHVQNLTNCDTCHR
jgi:Cytochrome c7 and related cytochrome c